MRVGSAFLFQRQTDLIGTQQNRLNRLITQISNGKQLVQPSDDPAKAAEIGNLQQVIARKTQFIENAQKAESYNVLMDNSLQQMVETMQQIRTNVIRAGDVALSDNERAQIAETVKVQMDQLIDLANTQFGAEEYIFAGGKSQTPPFALQGSKTVVYAGDQTARQVSINDHLSVPVTKSGFDLFMKVPTGNGTFVTAADSDNKSSAVIDGGTIVDPSAYVEDDYTINFVTNSDGDVAYQIFGATGGQLVPAPPADPIADAIKYESGETIALNGMNFKIENEAVDGDTFTISPSENQSIFDSVNQTISALQTNTELQGGPGLLDNNLARALDEIDNALQKIGEGQSAVGTSLNTISEQQNFLIDSKLLNQTLLSNVADLDMAKALGELAFQETTLQAVQLSFTKMQGLSLFNFIQ